MSKKRPQHFRVVAAWTLPVMLGVSVFGVSVFGVSVFGVSVLGAGSAQAQTLSITGPGISGSPSVTNGETLWSLVDNVTLPTTAGYNNKNAISHDYVVATGANGVQSVFSLGEIDTNFGGTNLAPYISLNGGKYTLVDPNAGAAARGVSNLQSLAVYAVPSLPTGAGGLSTSVNLSGLVTKPGSYTLADLQKFASVMVSAGSETYTGIPLVNFLNPSNSKAASQIVVAEGTDGYEVVYSLAELTPSLGGSLSNILAYAATGTDFTSSGDGVARTIFPTDNKHGRWMSNLDSLSVEAAFGTSLAVPGPVAGSGLLGLALLLLAGMWTRARGKARGWAVR